MTRLEMFGVYSSRAGSGLHFSNSEVVMKRTGIFDRKNLILAGVILACLVYFFFINELVFALGAGVLLLALLGREHAYLILGFGILCLFFFWVNSFNTLVKLSDISQDTYSKKNTVFANLFTPNTGIDAIDEKQMPVEVRQMLALITRNHLSDYRLDPAFEERDIVLARVIEAAWPVRLEPASRNALFSIHHTDLYSQCTPVDSEKEVILVHCP